MRKPSSAMWSTRRTIPAPRAMARIGPAAKAERAHRRARVELTEAGEDQGQEGGGEWGPLARSCALRFVHRG